MKLAIFSDIHSNYVAFKRCVDYIEELGITHIVFLGDYISDGANPQKTMDLVYELREKYTCWFLKGNREEYMLAHREGDPRYTWTVSSATGSLLYTYNNLREKDLDFFASLPTTDIVEIDGYPSFEICHGSLSNTRGVMYPNNAVSLESLSLMKTNLLVGGHIHMLFSTKYKKKKIICAGAIGVPMKDRGKCQFVILESEGGEWQEKMIRLKYDVEAAIQEIEESELNSMGCVWTHLLKRTLRDGINHTVNCLRIAHAIRESEGKDTLEESHWEKAVEKMGF